MHDIHGLTEEELKSTLTTLGEKGFRARQLIQWIYEKGAASWEEMTDLSKSLREMLPNHFRFKSLKLERVLDSQDQETTKFLWELSDEQYVESVLIRSEDRRTVCVSSQVGCAARCAFCASGRQGWKRHLTTAEIVEQVYLIDRWLKEKGERVSHVVFMGMGEPLENYESVIRAVRLLSDADRLHISQRRITVSTVGIVEKMRSLAAEGLKVNLVLSLHAPNQRTRQKIIPYARKYDLGDLISAMLFFARETGRDITYEYTLLAGINDSAEHAKELSLLLQGQPCTVNLIPYNPVQGLRLRRPHKDNIETFREILTDSGITTTWRYTKGKDIAAACGQLALQQKKESSTEKLACSPI